MAKDPVVVRRVRAVLLRRPIRGGWLLVWLGMVGGIVAETPPAPKGDGAANQFISKCAACHTIGGGDAGGPDLKDVGKQPVADLQKLVKRMEDNVGALSEEDIRQLTDLLRDPNAAARLKAEENHAAAQPSAEPPSSVAVAAGKNLFTGRTPLKNGGMSCRACHQAENLGGRLGPDLGNVRSRMREAALAASIEKAKFRVMEPVYRRHPVDFQEAKALAAYLMRLEPPATRIRELPLSLWTGLGSILLLAGVLLLQRDTSAPHPARLTRRRK